MLMMHYCATVAVNDDPARPLFGELRLRAPLTRPPFAGLASTSGPPADAAAAVDVTDGAPGASAAAAAAAAAEGAAGGRLSSARERAPPLGDTFREEDEDAVWSDEEPEPTSEQDAPPTAATTPASEPT